MAQEPYLFWWLFLCSQWAKMSSHLKKKIFDNFISSSEEWGRSKILVGDREVDEEIKIFMLFVTINSFEILSWFCLLNVHALSIIFNPFPSLTRLLIIL